MKMPNARFAPDVKGKFLFGSEGVKHDRNTEE